MTNLDYDLDRLSMPAIEVARLTGSRREARVTELMQESQYLVTAAIEKFITGDNRQLAGIVILFSGGNDSTVLAHLHREVATHAGHANTGVGVEQTRQFVRDTCKSWGLPLIEKRAPHLRDHYRELVLDQGFPGPAHHYKMFQRLKERALEAIRNEVVAGRSRSHRVVFLAGRRRTESIRRTNVPEFQRKGSIVWASPIVNWTKMDLNTYRRMHDVPVNEVSDLLHMSGECLCGSFAKQGERDEISRWYPEAFSEIAELERILAGPGYEHLRPYAKVWGWGWDTNHLKASRNPAKARVGYLCSACEDPHDAKTAHIIAGELS